MALLKAQVPSGCQRGITLLHSSSCEWSSFAWISPRPRLEAGTGTASRCESHCWQQSLQGFACLLTSKQANRDLLWQDKVPAATCLICSNPPNWTGMGLFFVISGQEFTLHSLVPGFPLTPYLIFLLPSVCYRFISKWLWVKRVLARSHMWGIHNVSWRWLLWSVCYTLLDPPPSAPCCVGHISQPAESEVYLHALSEAGLSGNLLKINRAITINKTIQGIQKFKLEFTNSQTVVTQEDF